jgi:hypothetical protein
VEASRFEEGAVGSGVIGGQQLRAESLDGLGLGVGLARCIRSETLDHVADVLELLLQMGLVGLQALDPDVATWKAAPTEATTAAAMFTVSSTHIRSPPLFCDGNYYQMITVSGRQLFHL